ncbi:MAG: helicase-exonuclease AddAB subunit AddA [Oscillospiraceae bacterium]|nr:helicase-exonuclease AddAB subunit AddA [Oscillospiraceae bacterium]
MSIRWTDEQRQAIEARGGSLLVSAAAGSGKTAVLAERVLRRLADESDPCDADELLIVTFTRLAAGEMRERIHKALGERCKAEPGNIRLQRQRQLLPLAQICTIDKFCFGLVKEHHAALGLPPELRLLDESETALWREEAAAETMETAYHRDSEAFRRLGLLLELSGDDERLAEAMRRTAELALANPNPAAFLDSLLEPYAGQCLSLRESPWGSLLLESAALRLAGLGRLAGRAARELREEDEALAAAYAPAMESDAAMLEKLGARARSSEWDAFRGALAGISWAKLGKKPKDADPDRVERYKKWRDQWKRKTAALKDLFCASEAEHGEDLLTLRPIVEEFLLLTRDFMARFAARKRESQTADFSDLLHWSLALLLSPEGEKTSLAETIAAQYAEILVDEFQDVNAAQGMLFDALSRDGGNLFLVGDVKQSIYRFRQASPELFLEKRRTHLPYDGENWPARVVLGRNFRSRRGVTQAVNFVFRQLMRREAAEMDYDAEEELVCGAAYYPENEGFETQLHLLDAQGAGAGERLQQEARYIAKYIAESIHRADLIFDKGQLRPAKPRDFCILMRSDSRAGMVFANALRDAGVAAHTARMESLFQSREIQLLLSLLRAVDNPLRDVPLLSLLLSPVVGFSPGDLALLRAAAPEAPSLYHCLRAGAGADGDTALRRGCADFLQWLGEYRRMSAMTLPGDFIRFLLEDTGLLAIAGAMKHPTRRRANLQRLEAYAVSYANTGAGLSGFLRYMDQIERGNRLLSVNEISESADVVRIMSIHKSKGLEFPVCILARCGAKFNTEDTRLPLLLHSRMGLGLSCPDEENRRRYPTVPCRAVRESMLFSAKSEELRLLYVAMTRAKERLVLLCAESGPEKKLQALAAQMSLAEPRLEPQNVQAAGCYADWLLSAAMRHPDAGALRELAGLPHSAALREASRWHICLSVAPGVEETTMAGEKQQIAGDPALLEEIRRRLEYRYPYARLTQLAAKRAVSELSEGAARERFAFSSRPAFLQKDSLTAAQKGSAMHAFLQHADYAAAIDHLSGELERLTRLGYLSAAEARALEIPKLRTFLASEFTRRMLTSGNLMREQKFTLCLPAAEFVSITGNSPESIAPELLEGEEVIVQGIVDCAFEEDGKLVLLDYKTDRVESMDELIGRYAGQLGLYRLAMERCFGMTVSELLIYSFWLGDWIEVDG